MTDDDDSAPPQPPPEPPSVLAGLPPDELFARGMGTVKISGTGGAWQAPEVAEAAAFFTGYEVIKLLGRGGMGAVYLARQIELDRLVALKLLPLEVSVDPAFADRFRLEARAMAKLNHPNIIAIHDFGKTSEGHLYFTMDYVQGANLLDVIQQVGLNPDQALSIAEQVCAALSYAHDKGIVHRDIKPANVMIDTESQVKVADFGLARLTNASDTNLRLGHSMTGTIMGTPEYMSPEQMKGLHVDHRADIYSVGVVLYEMLCGEVPHGAFAPPSVRAGCDPRIDPLVLKAMQPDPAHRFQTTREMRSAVSATRLALPDPAADDDPNARQMVIAQPQSPQLANPPKSAKGTQMLSLHFIGRPRPKPLRVLGGSALTEEAAEVQALPGPAGSQNRPGKSRGPLFLGIAASLLVLAAAAFFLFRAKTPRLPAIADQIGGPSVLAEATKDAPFVNTLGMKFVPVPIGGGPTGGQKVLFGVWDVRVQDYAVFAATYPNDGYWRGVNKDKVPVGREPDHPVMGVTWENAKDFCQWLTQKEQAEGKLPPGLAYRLPSDEEWSWAAGMPPEVGSLPSEKSQRNQVDFPWGTDYPPAKKVGNFADERYHAQFSQDEWFQGYNDGYVTTSPVGAFPPNAYGLYDMAGNALQWVEDWYDTAHQVHATRGSSWARSNRSRLLSSYRGFPPGIGFRDSSVGFRCVLSAMPGSVAASAPGGALSSNPPPVITPASAPSAALASLLAGTTKNQPFVNTLGMKFVPVLGTKVLFSIWDTRVQDYAIYAAANPQVDGAWRTQNKDGVPAGRELDHPVVGVSWEEAQAFCQWLTEKEQAEGKLPKGMKYRLPSDEEWSWAVGLPPELGTTPAEKTGKNSVDFPWGKDYPPTRKVGNYADEAYHAKFPAKKNEKNNKTENQWMEGYNDGYATTSPVGAFPANAYGLYDMGGNLWQWCEDWFDKDHKDRVSRGASWALSDRNSLLSSYRDRHVPTTRLSNHGFRCVLEPGAVAGVSAPAGPASPRPATAAVWQPFYTDAEWKRTIPGSHEIVDGRVHLRAPQLKQQPAADGAIRARIRFQQGSSEVGFFARVTTDGGHYKAELKSDRLVVLNYFATLGKQRTDAPLGEYVLPKPLQPGDSLLLELRLQGDHLTVLVDGSVAIEAQDARSPGPGRWGIFAIDGWFESAEVAEAQTLPPAAPSAQTAGAPIGATKDAPFVNSLGMKFVPVPITGGPTDKQRVLFSVWKTRVQDYAAFATETKREWKTAPYEQGPTHPAVNVSWEDAQAFCTWLTERERLAGRLPAGALFRLPSDHEWSCAVGIGTLEDPAKLPGEKSLLLPNIYPWGGKMPAPDDAGNYNSSEAEALPKQVGVHALATRHDGYGGTAPVGSYRPNALGLYDLGGNAWEWCEDWMDQQQLNRVMRGACFVDSVILSSARRASYPPKNVDFHCGFRVVLALPSESPATAAPATATKDAPFVNSLGMKFVPVPGTDVLFCIHETRWRDCGAYVNATGAEMSARGKAFVLGGAKGAPDVPAAHVSWDDAQAFCTWLSRQEGRTYRLPTDREWSQAVGIGDQEKWTADTTPATVNQVPDQFPWGTEWPPPKGAGNYRDESFHAQNKANEPYLKGYDDGFASPAPVMSFPPNRLGIYDLGGNVAEWVADWYDASQQQHTLRGANYADAIPNLLLSSKRGPVEASATNSGVGFRIVLERPPTAKAAPAPAPVAKPVNETEKWFAEVDGSQQEAYQKQVAKPYLAALTSLRTRYLASVDAALAKASAAGQLADALAWRKERQAFGKAPGMPADEAETPAAVKTLRATYRRELAKLDDDRQTKAKALLATYDTILAHNQTLLTQRQRLDEALFLDAKRKELAQAWSESPTALTMATKEAPFINSLGMKFVPVPIGGGPTAGKKVLFGIWDVRVQDYTAYAAPNPQIDGSWKTVTKDGIPVGRQSDHPMNYPVNVSWDDAQAFCQWLTTKEQAEGKLPKGVRYRLPTDEEWSWAVGLPAETGDTPEEKHRKTPSDFPWGKAWPPPANAGNYADESFHNKIPEKTRADGIILYRWIEGYTDGYVMTSPVGAFPANASGLCDMSGNVWQWCEDWYDATHKERTERGGSWVDFNRDYLRLSMRQHGDPTRGTYSTGFRCVLSAAEPGPTPANSVPAPSAASNPPTAAAPTGGPTGTPDPRPANPASPTPSPTPSPTNPAVPDNKPRPSPPASAAAVPMASKDAPFTNTLGMKFVPVPIGGGPTAGQTVLFSIWDTRIRDYSAYAASHPRSDIGWKSMQKDGIPVGQSDHPTNHPVNVSWDDAQAFCQWLTTKEQAEGKLPKGVRYRLPNDEEWSWAAGLPAEAGDTLAEKRSKNSGDYLWGKAWPPPPNVANYGDESYHSKFPEKKRADGVILNHWIEGYTDGYVTTSPVGAFPANAYGLYDISGNVWQWCEDWSDAAQKERVVRGGCWADYNRDYLRLSARFHGLPDRSTYGIGFRCVLSADPSAPAAAGNGH